MEGRKARSADARSEHVLAPALRRLLPAFVQRRLLLSAARRALAGGRPEAALVILADELLRQDPRAASLRTVVTPLVPVPPPPPPMAPAEPKSGPGRDELRQLLAEMRSKHAQAPADAVRASAPLPADGAPTIARPVRLRMSLDDAGSFLVAAGTHAVVGHSRAGAADLPILADLLPKHARFVLVLPSFHAGAGWNVEPEGEARVRVDERVVGKEGVPLSPGARVRLGENVTLRFEEPDSSSLSCALELEGGSEAAGARRILLFVPGAEGRLRIGPRSTRHVEAALGGVELELVHDGTTLRVACASGLIPDEAQGSPPLTHFELPLRLPRPVHLRLCMPTPSERPRWISFAPLEDA